MLKFNKSFFIQLFIVYLNYQTNIKTQNHDKHSKIKIRKYSKIPFHKRIYISRKVSSKNE